MVSLISILTALTLGQTGVPSVSIPPQNEPTVIFSDRGITYIIGLRSESVTKIDGGISPGPLPGPIPGPTPGPGPNPPPVPVVKVKPAWISLVVDPADTENLALRADRDVRNAVTKAGIGFRAYVTNDAEYSDLGLSGAVEGKKLPAVVLQKADGTIIETRSITKDELVKMIGGY